MLIISLLIIFCVITAVWQAYLENGLRQQARLELLQKAQDIGVVLALIPNFTASHTWIGTDLHRSIAIDEAQQHICFLNSFDEPFQQRVYPIREILDVSVVEDGTTLTQTRTSRGSQIGGAIVGGILLGGVGALIGGLSGKKVSTSSELVSQIDLQLTVNDTRNPVWIIPFLSVPQAKTSGLYISGKQAAISWHGLISVLIKRAEQNTLPPQIAPIHAQLAG
jgi:hypothetical protein